MVLIDHWVFCFATTFFCNLICMSRRKDPCSTKEAVSKRVLASPRRTRCLALGSTSLRGLGLSSYKDKYSLLPALRADRGLVLAARVAKPFDVTCFPVLFSRLNRTRIAFAA